MRRSDIFVINVIILFLTFGLAGLAVFHIIEDHVEPSFFGYLKRNWKQEPIVDIVKVDIDQTCPNGYKNLASYLWPGSNEACGCGNELYPQECRSTQILKGCKPIQEVTPKQLPNWELGASAFKLCKKTISGFNFYDKFNRFVSDCDPNTEKLCHNKSYPVCVPKEHQCPINSVSLGTITPNYFHNETIVINSDWIYYMARGDESYSYLADIVVEEGAGVCKEMDIPNLSKGRENYVLLRSQREYCRDLDTRFKQIGQVNEVDYFDVNGLLGDISALIGYKIDESYMYGLYTRNLIPWQQTCRSSILTDVKNLESYYDDSHQLRVFEIVWLLIVFVSYLIWIAIDIFYGKTSSQEELLAQQLQLRLDRRNIKILGFLILTVQQLLCFIYHVIFYSKYQNMSSSSCSDALTNSQITKTFNDFKNWTFSAYLTQFLFYLILIIIEFTVYFKIKNIAERNALQALLRAKQNAKNKTPDDENPHEDNGELPVIEEEHEKEPSEKGFQVVEFKMKRNVDKTKAKNPKVKKVNVQNEVVKNPADISVQNLDAVTENELQLLSNNNLVTLQPRLGGEGKTPEPEKQPAYNNNTAVNANSGGGSKDQKSNQRGSSNHQSSQQSAQPGNQDLKPDNNYNNNNANDLSVDELDLGPEPIGNMNRGLGNFSQPKKLNDRQQSTNELLISKNEISSRNDLAIGGKQDDSDEDGKDKQNNQKKPVKKKKRVR